MKADPAVCCGASPPDRGKEIGTIGRKHGEVRPRVRMQAHRRALRISRWAALRLLSGAERAAPFFLKSLRTWQEIAFLALWHGRRVPENSPGWQSAGLRPKLKLLRVRR
ncbi:hypothetical protein EYF80_015670 [Liparis tanakae]|uniref:Uncharacterized protein n=1 Tax=Liparis tanakae TaxID=230148 RepID=A0A4Z2I7L2_9TELE|nr:hypothetical protein EYF80_015670 [Liparis tanakae]